MRKLAQKKWNGFVKIDIDGRPFPIVLNDIAQVVWN